MIGAERLHVLEPARTGDVGAVIRSTLAGKEWSCSQSVDTSERLAAGCAWLVRGEITSSAASAAKVHGRCAQVALV
jgi:hypothetical protein